MNLFRSRDKPADWVIDSVIQYICSPVYSAPVLNFIEDRCVVFDSSEENKFSYTDAHRDFGKLIDYQLGNFMDETGINPNDFASALALDINSHQGVNRNALKSAFKHIEAVDNFLLFKTIMVTMNEDLNSRALEMLERSGMLTHPTNSQRTASRFSHDSRFSYTPPPPYSGYEAEDGVLKQLVSDGEVESFVRNLSNNLQEFDDTVGEQQETISRTIGIELEDRISEMEQLNFTEITNKPTPQARIYPNLDYPLNNIPTQAPIPVSTQEPEELISLTDPTTDNILTDPTMDNILTDPLTMDNTSIIDNILSNNQEYTGLEQECLTPVSIENKFKLPELPSQQKQRINMSAGGDRELFNEEVNSLGTALGERAQSPVEAANSLTQQWMVYAKEQQSMWKSSIDKEKVEPSEKDVTDREDHLKRQRDLLRKQRKQQRAAEQELTEGTTTTTQHIPPAQDGNSADTEKEKAKAEEARKFRRVLSAKLKREVVNRPKY